MELGCTAFGEFTPKEQLWFVPEGVVTWTSYEGYSGYCNPKVTQATIIRRSKPIFGKPKMLGWNTVYTNGILTSFGNRIGGTMGNHRPFLINLCDEKSRHRKFRGKRITSKSRHPEIKTIK